MPYHKKNPKHEISPHPDFEEYGGFQNAVVVVSNLVSRAVTKWTLQESKLFMLAVSQIDFRDSNDIVMIRKKDIVRSLNIKTTRSSELNSIIIGLQNKSDIMFVGKDADHYVRGFLIRQIKSDRNHFYIQFDSNYIDLLHYVQGNLFTAFEVQNLLGLKHKSSYNLYLYLTSWHDSNSYVNQRNIIKSDIPRIFNLEEGQYWRNYGAENARFDWHQFERRCLNPAVNDINSNPNCDMHITEVRKVKDPDYGQMVMGYSITWDYTCPDGMPKIQGEYKLLPAPGSDLTVEQKSMIRNFMNNFKKLNEDQLKTLSESLGINPWNGQLAWSITELKQEQPLDCIGHRLYESVQTSMGFEKDGIEKFAALFGYKNTKQETQYFLNDFEAIGIRLGHC